MSKSKAFHRFLVPTSLLAAFVLSVIVYGALVKSSYADLHEAILNAKPLQLAIARDGTIAEVEPDATTPVAERKLRVLRIMQNLGVMRPLAVVDDVPKQIWTAHGLEANSATDPIAISGVELLVRLAQAFGSSNSDQSGVEVDAKSAGFVAAGLAGIPGTRRHYRDCAQLWIKPRTEVPECNSPSLSVSVYAATLPDELPVESVVGSLFLHLGVVERFSKDAGEEAQRAIAAGYAKHIVLLISRDPAVERSRHWITIVVGPEQFAMLFLALAAVLLASSRLFAGAEIGEPPRGRAFLKWCPTAISSFGFIGTVRGLSNALAEADSVVSATSAVEQAKAIEEVATTLAFAFTTTLVALVLVLVVGLIEVVTQAFERRTPVGGSASEQSDVGAGAKVHGGSASEQSDAGADERVDSA